MAWQFLDWGNIYYGGDSVGYCRSVDLGASSQSNQSNQSVTSAFGVELSHTGGTVTPWGFAGGQAGDRGRQVKFGERYYDPSLGRWTQVDPLLSGSRYGYGFNNPVNLYDRDGTWPHIHRPDVGRSIRHTASRAWHATRRAARRARHTAGRAGRWIARNGPSVVAEAFSYVNNYVSVSLLAWGVIRCWRCALAQYGVLALGGLVCAAGILGSGVSAGIASFVAAWAWGALVSFTATRVYGSAFRHYRHRRRGPIYI